MESAIQESIKDLGYSDAGSVPSDQSVKYTELVHWLSSELRGIMCTDELIHPITKLDDWSSFVLEVNSFVKEHGAVLQFEKLGTPALRLQLLHWLATEVQAARLLASRGEASKQAATSKTARESETAADLRLMLMALQFPKPPDSITAQQMFAKVETKLTELKPKAALGKSLLPGGDMSEAQWTAVEQMCADMSAQYRMRAEMLLKRLDVTIQSFSWCDRVKQKEDEMAAVYRPLREALRCPHTPCVADVLAARDDLTSIEKTSSKRVTQSTRSKIQKFLMGKVPDRGGRPDEIQAPPPEMPSWQQRQSGPPARFAGRGRAGFDGGGGQRGGDRGGGRGRGGGDRGGGRVQGAGWNQQQQHHNYGGGGFAANYGHEQTLYGQPAYAGYQPLQQGQQQPYGAYNYGQQPQQQQNYGQQQRQQQQHHGQQQYYRGGGGGGGGRGRGRGRGRGY